MAVYEDGILYVDNSTLMSFAECETKAMMQYGYNLRPVDDLMAPARAGTAVHAALEVHYNGGTLGEAMNALYDSYYEFATTHIEAGDRLAYDNVVKIVESWIQSYPLDSLPYRIFEDGPSIEAAFDVPLTEGIRFVGRFDAIGTRTDGRGLYLIDTKSSGQLGSLFQRQFYLSTQLSGYWYALEQLGYQPTAAYINALDMRIMPSSNRKCTLHKSPYRDCGFLHMKHGLLGPFHRTHAQISTWLCNAIRIAFAWKVHLDLYGASVYDIKEVAQSGMFRYQMCERCGLFDFCRQGRPVDNADIAFRHDEWRPGPFSEKES